MTQNEGLRKLYLNSSALTVSTGLLTVRKKGIAHIHCQNGIFYANPP